MLKSPVFENILGYMKYSFPCLGWGQGEGGSEQRREGKTKETRWYFLGAGVTLDYSVWLFWFIHDVLLFCSVGSS